MKKILSFILLLAVSVMLVGCNNNDNKETNTNLMSIQVSVFDSEENKVYDEKIETEEKVLLDAMKKIEVLKIETEESQYGAFITSIKGIKQADNYFWNYYVNDDYASVGVSSYNIKDNDKIEFRLEAFE